MPFIRRLTTLWRNLVHWTSLDRDIDEELSSIRSMLADEKMSAGLSPAEARRAAEVEFGGLQQVKEQVREAHVGAFLDTLTQDLSYALRGLRRNPAFALSAVVALSLGMAATNTVFTWANAAVIRPLPFADPDRVVFVATRNRAQASAVSFPDFQDWRRSTHAFADLAVFTRTSMNLSDPEHASEQLSGMYVSSDTFRLLGVSPAIGRDFLPEDERPGAPAVVLLGNAVWKNRYGSDRTVIGRTVRVNGVASTVIGVMPEGFGFDWLVEVWQPIALMPGVAVQKRDARTLSVVGRLAAGTSIADARADLSQVVEHLARQYPDTNHDIEPTVVRFNERYLGTITDTFMVTLLGTAAFVLLIACANVSNLLLARAAHRSREMSIRASIGASRGRILRQLLVESLLLAVLAGALGLLLSVTAVRLLAAVVQENLPYWVHFTIDWRVFTFIVVVCLATSVVFGFAPALHLSRANLSDALKGGRHSHAATSPARRWTTPLIVVELSLTLVLLAGGGLLMRSLFALYQADRIVDTSPLTTISIRLPALTYATPERRLDFHQRLSERLAANERVRSAALTSALPFTPAGVSRRLLVLEVQPSTDGTLRETLPVVFISSHYFETMGVPLLRGRAFDDERDGSEGHGTAIVNERFVSQYWRGQDPIGRRIQLNAPGTASTSVWLTVIGVSPTIRQNVLNAEPVVYLPYRASPGLAVWLVARGATSAQAVASVVRDEVRALDPDIAVGIMTMDRLLSRARASSTVLGAILATFAAIGLVLSAVGLYGVTAYMVSQRRQEIGIRMALGAQRRHVLSIFLRRTAVQLVVGLIVGAAGAVAITRLLRNFVVSAVASDPMTLAASALALVLVALAASFWPARRAATLDPVRALRYE